MNDSYLTWQCRFTRILKSRSEVTIYLPSGEQPCNKVCDSENLATSETHVYLSPQNQRTENFRTQFPQIAASHICHVICKWKRNTMPVMMLQQWARSWMGSSTVSAGAVEKTYTIPNLSATISQELSWLKATALTFLVKRLPMHYSHLSKTGTHKTCRLIL